MSDEHEERDEHENPRPTVDLDALRAQAQGWSQLEIWTYLLRSYVDPREAAEIARGWIKGA
jgi:hypothetical protein